MTKQPESSRIPPYHPQHPETRAEIPERFLVDGYLKLRADGVWLFRGEKIEHRGLQRFLSQQLQRNQEGQYWVVNGPQRALVELEDTPFLVKRIWLQESEDRTKPPMLHVLLNDDSEESLLLQDLWMNEVGVLYTFVKRSQAGASPGETHLARISTDALLDLEPWLAEVDGDIVLQWSGGMQNIRVEKASTERTEE